MGTECVVKTQVLAGGRGLGYIKENNFQVSLFVMVSEDTEPLTYWI